MRPKNWQIVFFTVVLFSTLAGAQSRVSKTYKYVDPRGQAEFVICSQNLENYGAYGAVQAKNPQMTPEQFRAKEEDIVERFMLARCDVIAVQEVLAKDQAGGEKALKDLAALIKKKSNRFFSSRLGASNDPWLHNGFLVANDRADILNTVSYNKMALPKISPDEKARFFARGPFEIQLSVRGRDGSGVKTVSLITFHFKSKAGGMDDPTALEWETYRMEMAEALRRTVESRHEQSFQSPETILVLLGDRNSEPESASANILNGVLPLRVFQGEGLCRLSKKGRPLCQEGAAQPQKLFSVLTGDPQTRLLPGTYLRGKTGYWIDDIIMPVESMVYARADANSEGDYESGVLYKARGASDHALVWVKLNW